jgi:outer membrane biogenesis lipoprotein LolB
MKMNKLRKILILALIVAVASLVLTGCKSDNEHPTGEHPSEEHPSEEHPTEEHPTEEQPTEEHPAGEHPTE